ncbi:retinal-specific phospholipid-transporting ATPase ABCA4-like [Salvelinus fontinalis]|uniref:retinal-specific phospholipid-transporting ATPase ABCA4-like n=1 Tax=Salvelinus fontinalis TaxID=8038 RepID=UPI0024863081|nr:retinal-specific phospholipid-transporting ATPase ABCA4-like [Salvelinus fontinalis]
MMVKGLLCVYDGEENHPREEAHAQRDSEGNGVTNGHLGVTWFIDYFLVMASSTSMSTGILMGGKVLNYSNCLILFLFLLTFTTATIMQGFPLRRLKYQLTSCHCQDQRERLGKGKTEEEEKVH